MSHELRSQAIDLLRHNDSGGFTKPSPGQYPHLWNWDSALIALGYAHFDLPRALEEIRTLLGAQWRDGMVPHIVYPHGPSDYFPTPEFWRTAGLAHGGDVPSSGLTQPPLLATMARRIVETWGGTQALDVLDDPALLGGRETALDAIARWHRWLHTARALDDGGLPCLVHPWESGTDNSPRWLHAMDRIVPADLPPFKRRDTAHVVADERPRPQDYERFVHLIDVGRRAAWSAPDMLDRMPFLVQDVLFCSILHRADEDLLWLLDASRRNRARQRAEVEGWLDRTRQSFDRRFWHAERGLYLDFDVRAGEPIPVNTIATFAPLYAGLATSAQADRLVSDHLRNPREYAPDGDSAFALPSTSKDEPLYSPRRYWCGPVWINANWIVADGLRRYGYDEDAARLDRDCLELMRLSGFREYFDPRDGSGCGARDFSWSAALLLELLAEEPHRQWPRRP